MRCSTKIQLTFKICVICFDGLARFNWLSTQVSYWEIDSNQLMTQAVSRGAESIQLMTQAASQRMILIQFMTHASSENTDSDSADDSSGFQKY